MKKTIKTFVGRLRDAWSIIRGYNSVVYILFNKDVSKADALFTATFLTGIQWLKSKDDVNVPSRTDMLLDLLSSNNSIDGRIILVKGWYDCKRSGDYIIINTTEDINYSDVDPDRKFQWECFCERAVTPITWCYIEDLLPKGGEK